MSSYESSYLVYQVSHCQVTIVYLASNGNSLSYYQVVVVGVGVSIAIVVER